MNDIIYRSGGASMVKWKVAAYIRISHEVGADRRESNTLENQKSIIDGYFENELDYEIIDYYVDDGYTGTDFNRPAFQKLLDDIFSKKINAVIVKDLSRFGRNYARMGIYLGEVFPYRNVRFISVIDEIDSLYDPYYYDEIDFPIKMSYMNNIQKMFQ